MTDIRLYVQELYYVGDKMEMQKWNSEEGARLFIVGEIRQ